MLGVVAEQFPKGGALTLNAIAGIGMLTVGIIGGPMIGKMQEDSAKVALQEKMDGIYEQVSKDDTYFLGGYTAVDDSKVQMLAQAEKEEVQEIVKSAKQGALAKVTVFPGVMLLCYLALIMYFQSKGGYKPVVIDGQAAAAH